MITHVALYCRISKANGRVNKIEDQERWGQEYAAATWPGVPVVVYADNDISATKDDAMRPGYDQLREAIAAGRVAHLWAKEQSRIERDEIAWFQFSAFASANGLRWVHTRAEGVIDVGGVVAGIKAVLNAHEVRQLTARIRDRQDKQAEAGIPPGGCPFGYRRAVDAEGRRTYEIVAEQAEAIQWAAGKLLAGWSLSGIAKELRSRGLHGAHRVKVRDAAGEVVTDDDGEPVTKPSVLTGQSVWRFLTAPSIAGRRVHRGQDLGPGSGNWPAILDEATWQACRAKLAAPRTVVTVTGGAYPIGRNHRGNPGRRYLLTGGLAVCGVCGTHLVGAQLASDHKKPYLTCNATVRGVRVGKSCVGIILEPTEQYVVDELLKELDRPEFLAQLAADDHAGERDEITAALDAVEAQRKTLARMWGAGQLGGDEWQAARGGLDEQEAGLRASLAALPAPLVAVEISTVRNVWPDMTLDEKRDLIRLFVAKVVISPVRPGSRRRFDPSRISIKWVTR